MIRRLAAFSALCLVLLLFCPVVLAAEPTPDIFGEGPTRDPNAPEYSTDRPEELVPEQLVARSYYLTEVNSDVPLMERESNLRLYPASTTKILTALIALQLGNLDDELTVSPNAVNLAKDESKVPFAEGEVVTLRDALYGLLLPSGNDAAVAIAEHIGGDVETFVMYMNETAAMLGCTDTSFTNPHGLHDDFHQTTAHDLAVMMCAALENETFREIISSYTYDLSRTNKNPPRKIYNSNVHIDPENNYYYRFSIGGKTGFTSHAGYVLVEAAQKNGVELVAVAMYSNKYSRWPDTSRLFEFGFTQYKSVTVEEIYKSHPTTLQINGFSTEDTGIGELLLELRPVDTGRTVRFVGLAPEIDVIVDNFNEYTNIRVDVELRAPITQGQKMGLLTVYPRDEEPAEYELIASRSIAARENQPPTLEEIEQSVLNDPSPFPPFSLDWVLPPLILLAAGIFGIRFLFRTLLRQRKRRRRIPKPKSRTYN